MTVQTSATPPPPSNPPCHQLLNASAVPSPPTPLIHAASLQHLSSCPWGLSDYSLLFPHSSSLLCYHCMCLHVSCSFSDSAMITLTHNWLPNTVNGGYHWSSMIKFRNTCQWLEFLCYCSCYAQPTCDVSSGGKWKSFPWCEKWAQTSSCN